MKIVTENECDCKTCSGGEYDPDKFGGWRCQCSCHKKTHISIEQMMENTKKLVLELSKKDQK